jgi:hypothetical protein
MEFDPELACLMILLPCGKVNVGHRDRITAPVDYVRLTVLRRY